MCFTIFQKGKMPFLAIKTRSLKSRKMGVFPKRPWFWSKSINFSILLFQAKKASKMCFTTSQKEKTSFYAIKTRSSESRKIRIFPNRLVNGFGQKLLSFFILLFKAKQARKMCFTIFQKGKTPFVDDKNKKFKKSKIGIFCKGVSP